jgi:hypothetical protein
MSDDIKNRVAESGLITIDLEEWIQDVTFVSFDLMPLLWQGQVLREKDLREYLKSQSSDFYSGQVVFMPIPSDVILPQWTHLLVGSHFGQHCLAFFVGSEDQAKSSYLMKLIQEIDLQLFQDRMVIIKGCTQRFITAEVQNALMMKILPVVKSLMFGEPCSTVPLYKRKT